MEAEIRDSMTFCPSPSWMPADRITWQLNGCASTGSFLCSLGSDLVINQQSGMSRGLRFLIDRNRYHALVRLMAPFMTFSFIGGVLQDTVTNGYSPPMSTVIILAVSLGLTYVAFRVH